MLADVAKTIAPLGEHAVQVIGDPDMLVSRPSLGVGCDGPTEDMITAHGERWM